MVWVNVVHACQYSLLVLPGRTAVQQSREASVWVLEDGPFLLLAEVESFFGLEYLRGVGLLGLRGQDTWRRENNWQVTATKTCWSYLQEVLAPCHHLTSKTSWDYNKDSACNLAAVWLLCVYYGDDCVVVRVVL